MVNEEGSLENQLCERVQQGRNISGTLTTVTRNRAVSLEVKKLLHDCIVTPTLTPGKRTIFYRLVCFMSVKLKLILKYYMSTMQET